MRNLIMIVIMLGALDSGHAQTPAQAPPSPPKQAPAATRGAIQVQVTDSTGNPIQGVTVTLAGPTPRQGTTSADGSLRLASLRPGLYRLRFEAPAFVTLERELTLRAGQPAPVEIILTPAPAPEPVPPPPPVVAPPPAPPPEPPGEPQILSLIEYIGKNFIGRAPIKESIIAGMPGARAVLIQIREPLAEHTHVDSDEVVYVIAGEGIIRVLDREHAVDAGWLGVIPRGSPHSISRRGRNPISVLSIVAPPKP